MKSLQYAWITHTATRSYRTHNRKAEPAGIKCWLSFFWSGRPDQVKQQAYLANESAAEFEILSTEPNLPSDLYDVLVISGQDPVGWKTALEKQSRQLGIATRIHWPGLLVKDSKWGAFYGAEAFILPSHQENFGIAVAEGLACGRPALISDKVNIWRDVMNDGQDSPRQIQLKAPIL